MAARSWVIGVLVVCAALIGAFLGGPVAYAQGMVGGYVDVELILEAPVDVQAAGAHDLNIIVVNHGTRTAYDVEVVVDVVYPSESRFVSSYLPTASEVPVGSVFLDGTSFRWTIPALGGLQRRKVEALVSHEIYDGNVVVHDNSLDPHELYGAVTTASFDSNPENNTARIWSYNYNPTSPHQFVQVTGNYSVNVAVDESSPSPGDEVDFKITAYREGGYGLLPYIDLKVDIELTDGLTVTGTPSYATEGTLSVPDSVPGYSNGVFTIGTTKSAESRNISVTLPITVAANAGGGRQCLTATLTGNPPPGAGPDDDDPTDNVAKVCLGAPPAGEQVVLDSGTASVFTLYPCVDIETYPCDSSDDVRSRVMVPQKNGVAQRPGDVIFHVPDPQARIFDTHVNNSIEQSVNGGSAVSWHTVCDRTGTGCGAATDPVRDGVEIHWNRIPFNGHWRRDGPPATGVWTGVSSELQAAGVGGGDPPGAVHLRQSWTRNASVMLNTGNSWDGQWRTNYKPSGDSSNPSNYYLEFEQLGTYLVTYTLQATHFSKSGDCDTDGDQVNDAFCGPLTNIFHVGPIQDVEVRDGGSSDVASGRTAYTILAANNGPENTVDATVKITLPPGALVEDYVASEGTYANGAWTLPGLKLRDYRRSLGIPEEATLTLILKDGSVPQEPATATISLTDNSYNVCIGSDRSTLAHTTQATCVADTTAGGSWHEGTVYEYPNNNNEAKISARGSGAAGTSGGPMAPRFANTPVLTWESVPHVNNWPVYRYQVQYLSGNDWVDLADVPGTQTHFADTGAGSGRSYRVRALNEAGVPGFWSRSASQVTYRQASPPLNVTAEAGYPGEVVVSWEPSSDDGGSPITYYQAQWSRNGTSGWNNACRSDSASQHTCTNTGIPSGETRYYRVAAYAGGLGAWSDLAVATAVAGVPEAPSLSASRATSGSGDNILRAIRLTWSQPRDNGSTIYAYEIDYVDYDQVARKCGTDWEPLDGVGGPYSDSPVAREYLDAGYFGDGLEPGAYRCYRVRAVNNTGAGAWSNAASASAGGEVPPDEWLYLDGEADGQNAITLYWGEPHFDGGAPVTGYQLQYSEDGENWRNLTTTSASARSYTHTGRKVGETWHYQIRARNSAGWGGWSYPVTVTIEEGTTANLSQPTLTAQARTSKEVLLSWNSLCNPNREGDCESKGVDGYMVEYSDDGGLYGWERLTWLWTDQTTVLDSTVEPGATRYYRVAGYKEDNRRQLLGRWSQVKSATTADFSVGAPQNFTVVAEGERALKLEWEKPIAKEGDDSDSITGYRIERSTWNGDGAGDFDTSWVVRQTNRGIGPYVETGLTPNTQYYYQVAAVTRNGAVPYIGPYSMVSIFIPPAGN